MFKFVEWDELTELQKEFTKALESTHGSVSFYGKTALAKAIQAMIDEAIQKAVRELNNG